MPRGIPKPVMDRWDELNRGPLVRVVVYLEPRAVEDLELLVRYRFGSRTRSAIVREAVDQALVRHAAALIRLRRRRDRERREADEQRRASELSAEQREQEGRRVTVSEAIAIAREPD